MGVAIRRAGESDRQDVNRLLDEVFHNDPVSSWVFPDVEHRRRTHGTLMGAFLETALAEGYVDMAEDGSAVALWLSVPAGAHDDVAADVTAGVTAAVAADVTADVTAGVTADAAGGDAGDAGDAAASAAEDAAADADDEPAQLRQAVDPDNPRVEQIARLTGAAHPTDRAHEYLMLIAISQEVQGQGMGTALINSVLDRCDREGLHAYLEASSERSRALYERLGFTFTGTTIDLPDGPHMWPMWREPQTDSLAV